MKAFGYEATREPREAVQLVAGTSGAKYLGGGTNLVDLMRLGVESPDLLVDVSRLAGDQVETTDDGGLLVGAAVRNSDLAADTRVRADYPVLSEALLAGASGQLRNLATVGGNLLQRTRCLYFQDVSKACNKRVPGTGCPARGGIHRDLAVIGASDACIATHPSDMAVAMSALDAVAHVTGPDGDRTLTMDELYRLPGDDPSRDTTLAPADLITAVGLPPSGALFRGSAYRKARDRASYAFAVGAVAAALAVEDGVVRDVRIAFGAIAPRPWRARAAESALRGRAATAAEFARALAVELDAADPLPDNAFKVGLAQRLGVVTLARLAGVDADTDAERGLR